MKRLGFKGWVLFILFAVSLFISGILFNFEEMIAAIIALVIAIIFAILLAIYSKKKL